MKKYYLISTIVWLILSVFALIFAVYEIVVNGFSKGWVYLLALGLATFLFMRRYAAYRKLQEPKK
jgi:hypothetical protein